MPISEKLATPAAGALAKHRCGRPTRFSQELADTICVRLIDGESLRAICGSEGMPGKSTVLRWAAEMPAFREAYTEARELQLRMLSPLTDALLKRNAC